MKKRLSWFLLLLVSYLILLISDWKNLKYLPNLVKELRKLFKKGSCYTGNSDFILIPKPQIKDL
jgi:hypothetical protein